MTKRERIKKYIDTLDEDDIDYLYDELIGSNQPDRKSSMIIDGLKPMLTYLYFQMTSYELEHFFKFYSPVNLNH